MNAKLLTGTVVLMIICIVLMSGCTSEKRELVCNPPYIHVGKECCPDRNNNSVCDKDEPPETISETKTEGYGEEPAEIKAAEKVNEIMPETEKINEVDEVEKIDELDEIDEVEKWCLDEINYAVEHNGGVIAMPNDVKQYKSEWMCHNRYSLKNGGWVDMYWTKHEKEVYRVTTHPDGTVEEVKSGSGAGEQGNESYVCASINDSAKKNECYISLAVSQEDSSICNGLIMEAHDLCYREVATSKNDSLLCNRIENIEVKDDCYHTLALTVGDSLICGKIQTQDKREDCYNTIALSKEDPSICDKIETVGKMDDCYSTIALSKEDPSICDKINNVGKKDDCYNKIMGSRENPSLCNKIGDEDTRDECFRSAALSKEDPSLCDKIKYTIKRYDCYKEVAILKKESYICDNIESDDRREDCYKAIRG
jgi:hypothetical protein